MTELLEKPVSGVGAYYVKRLERLGIKTSRDLLRHFPTRYEDFSHVKRIGELRDGDICSVTAKVQEIKNRRAWRRRMFLTEAVVSDETGSMYAIWFNQPFLTRNIPKGALVSLAGKVQYGNKGLYFSNPGYEVVARHPHGDAALRRQERRHTAGLIPIYPETRGLTSRALRFLIQPLLKEASRLPDPLPEALRRRLGLMEFRKAIQAVHFPLSLKTADDARRRFAFEELFLFQLLLFLMKRKLKTLPAPVIKTDLAHVKQFIASLPFELTRDQKKAAWDILKDIAKPSPMNRLLNGDVGSGKTVVAAIAALETLAQGYQVALMAPTEILARQHFEKLFKFLGSFDAKLAMLAAKSTAIADDGLYGKVRRYTLLEKLKKGEPYFVIGTHALIQKEVSFGKLGLVIIDEQHRFGVTQRAHLTRGTQIPHLLSMTATPIPRTLALALYGDLDISLLRELPKGRKTIMTSVVPPARREATYAFMREEIRKGRQAFIICPRIEAQDVGYEEYLSLDTKAVKEEHQRLKEEVFPDLSLEMLHGKMKSEEKERIMATFAENKTHVLVSTSVVEVGIDIPNASAMMIEGADQFGLAQLHQFRGRVGRGEHQSYCFLFTDSAAKAARMRLEAFANVHDGFLLAEEDLKIRGPGEFFGTAQSGIPDLAMRSLKDLSLLELARNEARTLLEHDPQLQSAPFLKARLEEFRQEVHLE